jgi:hypothetical protein
MKGKETDWPTINDCAWAGEQTEGSHKCCTSVLNQRLKNVVKETPIKFLVLIFNTMIG